MAEHHEITGLTYAKTEQIGNASFSGIEGSDYSAGVSAQKKRKYNDPSLKGPSSGILESQNPLSIFNRVVNTNLNPPSVAFSLKQTETIKKQISKKKRDEVSTEADIKIQTFEFGAINGKDYRKLMGVGQIVMLDAQYWKDNADLLLNAQATVFERSKTVEKNNLSYGSSPHAHSVGMVNESLGEQDAKDIKEPAVLLERYRPVGVLKGVMMQQYGAFQKILVHLFGTARGEIHLFNYWMLCSRQPRAGVHLWFTLVEIVASAKQFFQWLPCTTNSSVPPCTSHKECMQKYLKKDPSGGLIENIAKVYGSIHVGKATNTHSLRNPDHWTEIVMQMTRKGGPNPDVWKKADKSQLYLRDALLC